MLQPLVRNSGFLLKHLGCIRLPPHARYTSAERGSVHYDVTVAGSGLIGGAMACAMGASPCFKDKKVLVLEGQPAPPIPDLKHPEPHKLYSNRVCAISPKSKELLSSIGVWEHISRKADVKKMQIWDSASNALLEFDKNDMTEDLCYIIENNAITSVIVSLLHEVYNENVEVKYSTKIKTCTIPKNYGREEPNDPIPNARIELENGDQIETSLLIAADGFNSIIAHQAKLPKLTWEYKQSAVVATLKLSEPSKNIVAWQRFLPTGPIAMLPLDDSHSSLVWSTSHDHASHLIEMEADDFVSTVNNAFWDEHQKSNYLYDAEDKFKSFLNSINPDADTTGLQFPPTVFALQGDRAKFPLGFHHRYEYVRPRLAIIGDAAHRVHPLAGQGANLGFGDVDCLMNILNSAVYEGRDIGCLSHLMKYEKERNLRNISVMGVIDALQKLYSTNFLPAVLLRTLGLMGTNSSRLLKEKIINLATS